EPGLAAIARETLAGIARRTPEAVLDLTSRGDTALRGLALSALGRAGVEPLRPRLLALAADPDPGTRAAAGAALLTALDVEETDRARVFLAEGEAGQARPLLLAVAGRCPGYPEAARLLAETLVAEGRTEEALSALAGSWLDEPEVDARAGAILLESGRVGEAVERLERARTATRGRTDLLLSWAEALLMLTPPRAHFALSHAREAGAEAPGLAAPFALAGRVLGEFLEDREGAAEAYRVAWQRDPGNPLWMERLRFYAGN
ncbi:MAG: tetratricopeptide repeat protein, partial [Planctomycetes bacterium]|nr:tetratricopeptide repeat protein [Planctomycetota bacterium]